MRIAIIFDSVFGNTAQIASAIGEALATGNDAQLFRMEEARNLDPSSWDILIVGSPTRGFRPTPATSEFLESLPRVHSAKAAAFDTRMALEDIHPAPLRWVVEAGGYAADRIDTQLAGKGFQRAGNPAGFFVSGTEGPMKPGEIDRAREWARSLL